MRGTMGTTTRTHAMQRLRFPDDTFPGLVFNDFIDKKPFKVHKYSACAVQIIQNMDSCTLYMDHEMNETLHVACQHPIPQRILYFAHNSIVIAKLNQYIALNMTCFCDTGTVKAYEHPSGIIMNVAKHSDNCFTYFLFRSKEGDET